MFCNKCGKSIADDSAFCSYCGNPIQSEKPLDKQSVICPKCDAEFDGDQIFCDKCGSKLILQKKCEKKAENLHKGSAVQTSTGKQNHSKYNLLATVLFALGICVCIIVLFFVLRDMGIING